MITRPALLFASLLGLGLASPQRGGRGADTNLCRYRCTDGGGCEVHYTGPPRYTSCKKGSKYFHFVYFLGEEKPKAPVSRSLLAVTAVEHLVSAWIATRR